MTGFDLFFSSTENETVLGCRKRADLDLIKNPKMTLPAVFKEVQLTVGRLKD